MRAAVHYAVDREELDRDPFRTVKEAADSPKEKGVLTFDERKRLLHTVSADPRSRLAVLLGLLCGMRRGEVRGLKWGDVDNGLIHLTHNFVNMDGLKKPKRGKERTVPYPDIVEKALEEVRKTAVRPAPDNYVFENIERPEKPMGETFFRNALRRELAEIGISDGKKAAKNTPAVPGEQKKRNLTFHSLRHSFITLGRMGGISDLEIQAIAGHSTRRMMEHYSHAEKVIDFNAMREKLNKAVGI
jgi:integrase